MTTPKDGQKWPYPKDNKDRKRMLREHEERYFDSVREFKRKYGDPYNPRD